MQLSENLTRYFLLLAEGTWLTVQLLLLAIVFGFLLSLPLVLMRRRGGWMAAFAGAYGFVMRGTPLLVQIYLLYYGLSQFETVKQSWLWKGFLETPFWCAVLALTLNTAAYKAEILFGALANVKTGEIEAAKSLGMNRKQIFWRIRYPIALRLGVQQYANEVLQLMKGSALGSTITLMEITGATRTIIAATYQPLVWLPVAGLLYILLSTVIAMVFRRWERYLMPYGSLG